MDLHRLAEERSVAYHGAIAEKIRRDPAVLDDARRRVDEWMRAAAQPPFYARKWAEVLARDVPAVTAFLVERSELATELRQSSPFAGALTPQERWTIFREFQARLAPAP
ncbi:MAG TPA: hypothetical protein VGE98_15095 [Thermoanaerobaculia bacterium]